MLQTKQALPVTSKTIYMIFQISLSAATTMQWRIAIDDADDAAQQTSSTLNACATPTTASHVYASWPKKDERMCFDCWVIFHFHPFWKVKVPIKTEVVTLTPNAPSHRRKEGNLSFMAKREPSERRNR